MRKGAAPARGVTAVVRRIRRYLEARAGLVVAFGGLGTLTGLFVLAWLFAGADGWGQGTAGPLILLIVGGFVLAALVTRVLTTLWRWTTEASVAGEAERTAALPKGAVRVQVELARAVPEGVSGSLARAGEQALLRRLDPRVERLAGRPGAALVRFVRIAALGSALLSVLAAGLLVATPGRALSAWAGLMTPLALLVPEPLPPLALLPGDAEVLRGEQPRIEVRAAGRDSVTVHWQAIGDILRERTLPVGEGSAETMLPPIEVATGYWASSPDGARTETGRLVPIDPSLLTDLRLDLSYPPHTLLPPESLRGVPPRLALPEGTAIGITGRVVGGGSEVLLLGDEGGIALRLPVEEGEFSGSWRPARSDRISWNVEGGREGAVLSQVLDLELVPDEPPELALPVPGRDAELPLSLQLPLLLEATDDYGIAWAEFETVHQSPGEEDRPVVDRIPVPGLAELTLRPILDFSSWGLRPGDAVLLRARVSDNAPAPHVVETATYRLSMPTADAIRDAARERVTEVSSRTEELMERVARETEALRDLERQIQFEPEGSRGDEDEPEGFQDREELRQALEQQAELASELDLLRTELEEASEALAEMAESDPADLELQEEIERLEQLLEEVLGPEAREELDELQEALREGETEAATERMLEELAERQERLENRLEQALEELRESVIEEAFRAAEGDIEELLETQERLVPELSEGRGAEEQLEQAERTGAVEERLSALGEELASRGDSDAGQQTEAARRELENARESMEAAAEESRSGQPEQAAEEASQAAESLEAAREQLGDTRSQMAENPGEAMREGLRRGAQDALALARRQEALTGRLEADASPESLGDAELAIMQGLRNLSAQLREATAEVPELQDMLEQAAEASEQAVGEAVGQLRRGSGTPAELGEAQGALNRLALVALSGLGMGGQESQGASAEEQMAQEMSSIGAQQSSLNEESGRLSDQSSPGGEPAPMQLEHLVTGQQGVAARLQELARRPGPGGTRSTLDALAQESDGIADELREGRLDATTRERQGELLERLLSAGRTLERERPTDEREATSAEEVPRRAITAIPEELLDRLALPLPSAAELGGLTPAERRLVLEYFERVNRRLGTGGAP